MKNNFLYLIFFIIFLSCGKKEKKVLDDPQQGHISIEVDGSFKSVLEALTESYTTLNPKAKIDLITKKEDFEFLDLLNGKTRVIVMSRELSPKERAAYDQKTKLKWQPAKFAGDAVVFVVPKASARNSIGYEEIQQKLNAKDEDIVFDGTNSSNLNFVAQKLNKKPSELQFSVISGNDNLVEQLKNYPNKIGVISLNTISRPYGTEAEKLRSLIKILPVVKDGKFYEPSLSNIKNMTYPFTRILYFLTNEAYYGLGNGFIRFSCTQLGQIIVEKEGLQPYNTYKREVQMR
jgi:phosphate transport system substrate-binding protein